jgi:DNA-binding beta-propeller fold protein YncE
MKTRLFGRGTRLVTLFLVVASLQAAAEYHVIKRIPIPGDSGWDYITTDTAGRHLYVPHGTEVVMLDLDSGKIVGKIADLKGVHGVALAREFGHGFISATDPGSVTMFDLKSLRVLNKERVGDDPNGIIYDPFTKRIFSADRGSQRLTAIDAKTGKVAGAVDNLGGRTEHLASDEAGHIFLNMQDVGKLHKIDARNLKVLETWQIAPPCGQPSSMDIDRTHNRVFIGCRGGGPSQPPLPTVLAVVDASNGKVVATQPIGAGVDALEFDAKTGMIYVSTGGGDGALSIFHQDSPDHYSLVAKRKDPAGRAHFGSGSQNGNSVSARRRFRSCPATDARQPASPAAHGPRNIFCLGGRQIANHECRLAAGLSF